MAGDPIANEQVRIWRYEDQYGAEAPPDTDRRLIIAAWLWDEQVELSACTDAEVAGLIDRMKFSRLWSVVKADREYLDPDDCGGFHSEGSGKRSMDAWFIEASAIFTVVDAVVAREKEARSARA